MRSQFGAKSWLTRGFGRVGNATTGLERSPNQEQSGGPSPPEAAAGSALNLQPHSDPCDSDRSRGQGAVRQEDLCKASPSTYHDVSKLDAIGPAMSGRSLGCPRRPRLTVR